MLQKCVVLQKVVKFCKVVFVIEGCEVAIKYLANSLRRVAKCVGLAKVVKLQSVFCN